MVLFTNSFVKEEQELTKGAEANEKMVDNMQRLPAADNPLC